MHTSNRSLGFFLHMCAWRKCAFELADVGKIVLLIFKGGKKLHQGFFKNDPVRFAGISCIQFQAGASAFREGNFNMEIEVLFI